MNKINAFFSVGQSKMILIMKNITQSKNAVYLHGYKCTFKLSLIHI